VKTLISESSSQTRHIAEEFARNLEPPAVICLHGDLGAGKTCFVQGLAKGLGWEEGVTSPTFGLVQEFRTQPPLIHADLYRLNHPSEIWSLGLEEWLEEDAIVAVEWSERVKDFWPDDAWQVEICALENAGNIREIRMWREGEDDQTRTGP